MKLKSLSNRGNVIRYISSWQSGMKTVINKKLPKSSDSNSYHLSGLENLSGMLLTQVRGRVWCPENPIKESWFFSLLWLETWTEALVWTEKKTPNILEELVPTRIKKDLWIYPLHLLSLSTYFHGFSNWAKSYIWGELCISVSSHPPDNYYYQHSS